MSKRDMVSAPQNLQFIEEGKHQVNPSDWHLSNYNTW